MTGNRQTIVDRFYAKRGPCCAGCDWWRHVNSVAGECTQTAPVDGIQRFAMLGVTASSLPPGAGHIMTLRDHCCGQFKDDSRAAAAIDEGRQTK